MTPDELVPAVLEALKPYLIELRNDLASGITAPPVPRPATVLAFDSSTGEAVVVVDGDDNDDGDDPSSFAQVIAPTPLAEGDRVYTLAIPPHGLLVIGHVYGFPVLQGVDYAVTSGADALVVTPAFAELRNFAPVDTPIAKAYRIVAHGRAVLFSNTAGSIDGLFEVGVSVDGGTTWVTRTGEMSASGNGIYSSVGAIADADGTDPTVTPLVRVRANLAGAASGYELRKITTHWTITPAP